MDECDSEDRSCPTDGVCIARGRFAESVCFQVIIIANIPWFRPLVMQAFNVPRLINT